jgi:toxin YoeB
LTSRGVIFDVQFREDLHWWFRKDQKVSNRILNLIEATTLNPFEGVGKPEHLKYFSGSRWSRRITQEHRLVYQVSSDKIIFLQCRYYYE